MNPKTRHRDHEVEFDPQTEEWKCGALMLSDKSLARLKGAIDRESKRRRRVSVPALYLHEGYRRGSDGYTYEVLECSIVLLREGDRNAYIKLAGKREQHNVTIRELYPLDQKNKLEAFVTAKNRANAAEAEASAIQDDLTNWTADAVREAVVRQADEAA